MDLTGENDPFQDDYGHGTFVAGLIAGDGTSSGGQYQGEAPGADLVSIKVAGADGTTDLVRLILGLQWAIQNRLTYNIQVLNMLPGLPAVRVHHHQPAGPGGRGGLELGHRGRGLGGQRRADQRHHPVSR